MDYTWEPWKTFNASPEPLAIEAPPCPQCKSWKPHRVFDQRGNFAGVRLCVSNDMQNDFSCFKSREPAPGEIA